MFLIMMMGRIHGVPGRTTLIDFRSNCCDDGRGRLKTPFPQSSYRMGDGKARVLQTSEFSFLEWHHSSSSKHMLSICTLPVLHQYSLLYSLELLSAFFTSRQRIYRRNLHSIYSNTSSAKAECRPDNLVNFWPTMY
jgi:hypothetical protein